VAEEHKLTVENRPGWGRGPAGMPPYQRYRSVCPCGWRSRWVTWAYEAVVRGEEHIAEEKENNRA
jgi:hypothetical protein